MLAFWISPSRVKRIKASWLAEPIGRYIDWLVERRCSPETIDNRPPLLIHFGQFAWRRGARRVEDLPPHVPAFVRHWVRRCRRSGPRAVRAATQQARGWVEQMLRLAVPAFQSGRASESPWPFRDAAPGFLPYLREERGLSPATILIYGYYLRGFERYLAKRNLSQLPELSPARLSDYIIALGERLGRRSVTICVAALRTFLRFAEREQLVARGLAQSVDRPRSYRLAGVPRSITWADATRLLGGVDRRTAAGKRDYAVLLLLLTYGLRAREVAALTLADIDWRRAQLMVPRRKGGHSHVYPLVAPVGDAIIDYLRNARPASEERRVFLLARAPFTPLTYINVGHRAETRLRQAGIVVPRPGSHTLRHTCVQRLVDAGFSLKEIGDFVGHRDPATTQIYGKVAIESLRGVARDRGEGAL